MQYAGRSPYGEIYTTPTTAVDNIARKIYVDQQQREFQKRQDNKMLDDEFGRNVAGVKSADIPELTSAYNDFKQSHIALQKKKGATPQDQMELMIKKAKVNEIINASKEDKEYLKLRAGEIKGDSKGRYNTDAHLRLQEMLNTPTSKRKREFDDDVLKYKYSMPNIDKELLNASKRQDGDEFEIPVGVDEKDPLKDKVEVYKRMNNPNVFYDKLFTSLGARPDNKNFVMSVMDNVSDDELEKLRTRYELKIQDPKFKAIYGEVKPFPSSAGQTDLGKAVAVKTMEVVDNLPLTPVKEKSVTNESRKKEKDMVDWKAKNEIKDAQWYKHNALTYKQSLNKIAANKQAGLPSPDMGYVSDEVGEEVGVEQKIKLDGKERDVRVIYVDQVDPERLDIITGRDLSKKKLGVKPIQIKQPDGTYKYGYYQDAGTGDWEGLDGQKISREAVKDRYIQSKAGTKFKAETGTKGSENTNKSGTKPKSNPLGLKF